MIGYNELYELLRKEKYAEPLQPLPKNFIEDFSDYLSENKGNDSSPSNPLNEGFDRNKKQFENAIAIFRELILRRKKKLLNLVFVATETGIMKRDYDNMLKHEREVFDSLVKSFEDGDKELSRVLNGKREKEEKQRMVMFTQSIEEFVGHTGEIIGPFASGELVNMDSGIAEILVKGGKASYVDED